MKNLPETKEKNKIVRLTNSDYPLFNVTSIVEKEGNYIIDYKRKDGTEWQMTVKKELVATIEQEM